MPENPKAPQKPLATTQNSTKRARVVALVAATVDAPKTIGGRRGKGAPKLDSSIGEGWT